MATKKDVGLLACWDSPPIEIKKHLNLEHTIVLKQSMCMLIAERPTSLSEKFINFF